jgi:RNA polymerase sigma-70 factor (ECF subfamily)
VPQDQHQPPDSALVKMVLNGARDRFRELVRRHQARVYGVCLRLVGNPADAEDLTQHSFVEAFKGLQRYDGSRSFTTWLMCITVNNCKDFLKSHKRRERQLSVDVDSGGALFTGRVPDPEQQLVTRRRAVLVEAALSRLDPKYRVPLVLKDVEGLSYQEMQEILPLPLTTLKIRVVRGRAKLQEQLEWMTQEN